MNNEYFVMKHPYFQPEVSVTQIESMTVICVSLPNGGGGDPIEAV